MKMLLVFSSADELAYFEEYSTITPALLFGSQFVAKQRQRL
jgi:hypothetical protein